MGWKTSLMSNTQFLQFTLTIFIHGTEIQLCQQEAPGHVYRHAFTSLPNVRVYEMMKERGTKKEVNHSISFYILYHSVFSE